MYCIVKILLDLILRALVNNNNSNTRRQEKAFGGDIRFMS